MLRDWLFLVGRIIVAVGVLWAGVTLIVHREYSFWVNAGIELAGTFLGILVLTIPIPGLQRSAPPQE